MTLPDLPPFDTQQAAAELREHGFDQQQADAIVRADAIATVNLATKDDLKAAMDKQTSELRVEFQKAINGQTWRFLTALGVMLGLLRWLFPVTPVS